MNGWIDFSKCVARTWTKNNPLFIQTRIMRRSIVILAFHGFKCTLPQVVISFDREFIVCTLWYYEKSYNWSIKELGTYESSVGGKNWDSDWHLT